MYIYICLFIHIHIYIFHLQIVQFLQAKPKSSAALAAAAPKSSARRTAAGAVDPGVSRGAQPKRRAQADRCLGFGGKMMENYGKIGKMWGKRWNIWGFLLGKCGENHGKSYFFEEELMELLTKMVKTGGKSWENHGKPGGLIIFDGKTQETVGKITWNVFVWRSWRFGRDQQFSSLFRVRIVEIALINSHGENQGWNTSIAVQLGGDGGVKLGVYLKLFHVQCITLW